MTASAPTDALSGTEVAGAVAGGLACKGVWVWIVTVALGAWFATRNLLTTI